MQAYQKIVRDKKAIEESGENLFGSWWDSVDKDLSKTTVRELDFLTAKELIEKYEWMGCLPAVNWYFYGIFFGDVCGGAVVFGPEYSENLGVWDKYDFTGKMILLSRGVCVHWTPPNTGSRLIMEAIKLLPEKYKIVTCTTDILAGEIGTIYQACNFNYVGCMRENNPKTKGKPSRDAWRINGKLYGSRSIRSKIGNQKQEDILRAYPDAEYVEQVSKDRYFYFRGSRKDKKYLMSKISDQIKPYPKRGKDQE